MREPSNRLLHKEKRWRVEPSESPLTLSLSPWERERHRKLRASFTKLYS